MSHGIAAHEQVGSGHAGGMEQVRAGHSADHAAHGPPTTNNTHADHATTHADHQPATDAHAGHGGHAGHAEMFRKRFWASLALTIPVVLYSEMLMDLTGWMPPEFSGDRWVAPVLGTLTFL